MAADPLERWIANVEQQTEVKIYCGVGLYGYSSSRLQMSVLSCGPDQTDE